MNLMFSHLSSIKARIVMVIMMMGMLLNSCKKEILTAPLNVGTIRFAANSYTIENNTVEPLTIVLPLSLPLEEAATAVISIDDQSTALPSQYAVTPEVPTAGLTLNLEKGATEASFKINSLNNFEGEKTVVLKLTSATGGLSVAKTDVITTVNIKGNPIILPEIKVSEPALAFGNTVTGTTSASKPYVITSVKLTSDVLINASSNFEISLNNTAFSSSLSIPVATANAAPVTVYARFVANTGANQTVTGTISHSSGTVPDATVNITGVEYGVASTGVLLKKDEFSYASAGPITAASAGAWTAFSASGTNAIQYITAGLSYAGYSGSGIGGALTMENNKNSSEDVSWNFPAQTSGVMYTAQMVNFASAPTTGDFFFSLGDGAAGSTPVYYNRVYAKANGAQLALGLGRNSATATYASTGLDYGTTYLVVTKYEFATGVSSLYILSGSIPVIEPPTASANSNTSGADPAAMTRVAIRQSTNLPLKVTIDGIRIATSWREAVGL